MSKFQFPESMEDLVYMTNRSLDNDGKIAVWVYRQDCPECGKAKMTKPKDPKTGKYKIRAKEYVCSECNHSVEKDEYEPTLEAQADLTCPNCKKHSEVILPFKRKKTYGVNTLPVPCPDCGHVIQVTKKMKAIKKKAKKKKKA